MTRSSKILILGGILVLAAAAAFLGRDYIFLRFYEPTPTSLEEGISIKEGAEIKKEGTRVKIIAENLKIPWEIVFLPLETGFSGGDFLVTERPRILKRIGKDQKTYIVEGARHIGEGGLLGATLHPDFIKNRWIYFYFTTKAGNETVNRVERYKFNGDKLSEKKVIIDSIPGAIYHDGGRIAFGPASVPTAVGTTAGKPDYYLYITTGDAGQPALAQDKNSLAGKILRLKDDGSIPSDNPFRNAVFSYGHRNPQGIAWDSEGRLWSTEHGRSGILSGLDELNLIEKGKNYGWPIIQGDETKEGMEPPVAQSGPDETWAPGGIAFLNNSLFFAGLRGESLYEVKIKNNKVESIKAHFRKEFGRLRTVVLGPDGYLYITTSNTDDRGEPKTGDDKIIRVDPRIFR